MSECKYYEVEGGVCICKKRKVILCEAVPPFDVECPKEFTCDESDIGE